MPDIKTATKFKSIGKYKVKIQNKSSSFIKF